MAAYDLANAYKGQLDIERTQSLEILRQVKDQSDHDLREEMVWRVGAHSVIGLLNAALEKIDSTHPALNREMQKDLIDQARKVAAKDVNFGNLASREFGAKALPQLNYKGLSREQYEAAYLELASLDFENMAEKIVLLRELALASPNHPLVNANSDARRAVRKLARTLFTDLRQATDNKALRKLCIDTSKIILRSGFDKEGIRILEEHLDNLRRKATTRIEEAEKEIPVIEKRLEMTPQQIGDEWALSELVKGNAPQVMLEAHNVLREAEAALKQHQSTPVPDGFFKRMGYNNTLQNLKNTCQRALKNYQKEAEKVWPAAQRLAYGEKVRVELTQQLAALRHKISKAQSDLSAFNDPGNPHPLGIDNESDAYTRELISDKRVTPVESLGNLQDIKKLERTLNTERHSKAEFWTVTLAAFRYLEMLDPYHPLVEKSSQYLAHLRDLAFKAMDAGIKSGNEGAALESLSQEALGLDLSFGTSPEVLRRMDDSCPLEAYPGELQALRRRVAMLENRQLAQDFRLRYQGSGGQSDLEARRKALPAYTRTIAQTSREQSNPLADQDHDANHHDEEGFGDERAQ